MALKDKKLNGAEKVEEGLAAAVRGRLKNGLLPCAEAFNLAEELSLPRAEVGRAADVLEVHLTTCQLGLFGYPGKSKYWETTARTEQIVHGALEEAVLATRDKTNIISCEALLAIAQRFGLPPWQAGFAADRLGVRIKRCQLGAF